MNKGNTEGWANAHSFLFIELLHFIENIMDLCPTLQRWAQGRLLYR